MVECNIFLTLDESESYKFESFSHVKKKKLYITIAYDKLWK